MFRLVVDVCAKSGAGDEATGEGSEHRVGSHVRAHSSSSSSSATPPMTSADLTPTRRLPFPMASQPSPAHPQRSSPALPQLPPSSSSSLPLSADVLLKTHSAAYDPKLAALEQAISERNNLSAQNSQLWKLIEKQRAGYNHILKELERIRGERDAYKAKLGISNSSSKRDRTHKLSVTQQSDDHRPSLLLVSSTVINIDPQTPQTPAPFPHARPPLLHSLASHV